MSGQSASGTDHVEHREKFTCTECDDFELEKNFSGIAGTPGKEEYGRIQAPDRCPACGGDIERSVDTGSEQ